VGGAGPSNQPNNATQQRTGGGRGGRGGRGELKDNTVSISDVTLLPDGRFAGREKAAKALAATWNK